MYLCFWLLVDVVGEVGRGLGPGSRAVGWCYVCVRCESGLSVWMAGPGICVLCLEDTCTSEVHPVFNPLPKIGKSLLHYWGQGG